MIKNILFDLGHVIIDIEFDRSIRAFKELGQQDFHLSLDPHIPIFEDFEVGRISPDAFIRYWTKRIKGSEKDDIINAWNALLVGITPDKFNLLNELKKRYTLFIYSNTNAIHIEWVKNYLLKKFGMPDWEPSIFKKAYYSHDLGYRKPDKRGFLKILENENLYPEETLFIDDHLVNIQAALELGIQAIHKEKNEQLVKTIEDNDLL